MRVSVEFGQMLGEPPAICNGVLPNTAAEAFSVVTVLQVQTGSISRDGSTTCEEMDFTIENNDESRLLFLLNKVKQLESVSQNCNTQEREDNDPIPVCIRVKYTDGVFGLLFLPPYCWRREAQFFARGDVKKIMEYNWDLTGRALRVEGQASSIADDKRETLRSLESAFDTIKWVLFQARQEPGYEARAEIYKGIALGQGAVAHRMLCERLEKDGYMFIFEAPFILPGDTRSGFNSRRMDLLVFRDQAALIIEVDGSQHDEWKQRDDDYVRDGLIQRHWFKMRRFTNYEVVNHLDRVMEEIDSLLDPRSNTSAR
jgi:hypothetical protein